MAANVVRLDAGRSDGTDLLTAIEGFLADADLAPSSVKVYTRTLEALVEHLGSDLTVDQINRSKLEEFLKDRYGHTQATTYNRNVATIGSFFAWCEDRDLMAVSPARKVKRRKVRRTREAERQQRPIPQAEIEALWSNTQHSLRERAFWVMLYETAARANEILGLNIEHLDTANKDAVIIGKGRNAERVYWASATARLLPRLINGRQQGPLFLTDRAPRSHVLPAAADLCPETGRARLSYRRAEELFKAASGGKTLHQLRHSALTHYAENGKTVLEIRGKSRHRSVRSLERYVAPSPKAIRAMTDNQDVNRRNR